MKGAKSKIRCDYDGSHAFAFSYTSKDPNVLGVSCMAVTLVGKVSVFINGGLLGGDFRLSRGQTWNWGCVPLAL